MEDKGQIILYQTEDGQSQETTCAFFAQVQNEGLREVVRSIPFYNLDIIISVGYRVNSKRGIQFRQWATQVLRQYLVKGYAVNQKRLEHYDELKNVVHMMSRALSLQEKVSNNEYSGLFNVIGDYVYALDTLDRYDYQELSINKTTKEEHFRATYENAMEAIAVLKEKGSSYGSWKRTAFSMAKMEENVLQTTPSLRSL